MTATNLCFCVPLLFNYSWLFSVWRPGLTLSISLAGKFIVSNSTLFKRLTRVFFFLSQKDKRRKTCTKSNQISLMKAFGKVCLALCFDRKSIAMSHFLFFPASSLSCSSALLSELLCLPSHYYVYALCGQK